MTDVERKLQRSETVLYQKEMHEDLTSYLRHRHPNGTWESLKCQHYTGSHQYRYIICSTRMALVIRAFKEGWSDGRASGRMVSRCPSRN